MVEELALDKGRLASLFFDFLEERHHISSDDITKLMAEKQSLQIPISILQSRQVGCFEAIIKYLRDAEELPAKKIAEITGRSPSTIGVAYSKATHKLGKSHLKPKSSGKEYFFPAALLRPRKLSVLESVVCHLKEQHSLSHHAIARLLNRDDRTIWTVYSRAMQKGVKP